ncbi:hypothetical protein BP6252_01762 [Coleophoma cylindrospora]|uniref:Fe2OG dioxygenase domain-containing protein n=1 Tax=Coleophoma cylindrospora TaxID=1849047 RepID=A0A3D8STS8_9HELO|nr:hypothetical protein BP6252_01762 [Coleophoma cylindrospora]
MAEVVELSSPPSDDDESIMSYDGDTLLAEDLERCLASIRSSSSFAFFSALDRAPNPGLSLKVGGTIGLPLSDRDADAIVSVARQAPFGKGTETVVDETVRKTWEVAPSDFELRNPAWPAFVREIVTKVSAGLGVTSYGAGVHAELYKLLLYDKGAMFKPHQDSEKAPRMFGTLVIALPSEHQGGQLVATFLGQTMTFETSEISAFDYSCLAWYSDVMHEVKPITSGRRLALTYNLIYNGYGYEELTASTNKTLSALKSLFKWWKANPDPVIRPALVYLFDYSYTEVNICFANLKGRDQRVTTQLREACADAGFELYLANIKRSIEGACDESEDDYYGYRGGYGRDLDGGIHEITDEIDCSINIQCVFDLDGTIVAKDILLDEDLFIQTDPFEGIDPDDEDYSGPTGNEGVTTTHFYNRTVGRITLAKSEQRGFLFGPENDSEGKNCALELANIKAKLRRNPDSDEAQKRLRQLCSLVLKHAKLKDLGNSIIRPVWPKRTFKDPFLAALLRATKFLKNSTHHIFMELLDLCLSRMSKHFFTSFQSVSFALIRYNLESLLPRVSLALRQLNNLADRGCVLEAFEAGIEQVAAAIPTEDVTVYLTWLRTEIIASIASMPLRTVGDGKVAARILFKVAKQEAFDHVLPAVKRNIEYNAMVISFSVAVFKALDSEHNNSSAVKPLAATIIEDVVADLAADFNLASLEPKSNVEEPNKRTILGYGHSYYSAYQPPPRDDTNSKNLAFLLTLCNGSDMSRGMITQLETLMAKISIKARTSSATSYKDFFLPLLTELSKILSVTTHPIHDNFKRLFLDILGFYILQCVSPKPKKPIGWERAKRGCGCSDCLQLDSFLEDPAQRSAGFRMNDQRRKHLQTQLKSGQYLSHVERIPPTPYPLVVTKLNGEHAAEYDRWTRQCNTIKEELQRMDCDFLDTFLGESYKILLSFDKARIEELTSSNSNDQDTLASSSGGKSLPPPSRRKEPTHATDQEVIVLDD